jgi:phenylacetate-CoA ligase
MTATGTGPRGRGTGVLARLGLPLGRALVGRRLNAALGELRAAMRMDPASLAARQDARLRALVAHAFDRVPFWREVARDRGLRASDIRGSADLHLLPVVDKELFRSRPLEDFLAVGVPAWRHLPYATSGSTGDPFRFVLDRRAMPLVFASHLFYDSWYGLDPLARSIRIMGPPARDPAPRGAPLPVRLRSALTAGLQRRYERLTQRRLATFEARPERVRAAIEAFRPAYLLGYTGTLAAIADEFLRTGYRPSRPLDAVVTIAETLTPERRAVLERCFGAPIANRYGQREFKYWCAQSLPGDPMRFCCNTELVVFETLRADGSAAAPGEVGRVVLTNLHNEVMPFLRYDTGDLGALGASSWPDGPGFPMMNRLDGRTQEVLSTPSGRTIDATTLGHHLFVLRGHVDAVRQYQLVQEGPDAVVLRVVPVAGCGEALRDRLATDLGELLGEGLAIRIEVTDAIPLEKSGKRPILKLHHPGPAHVDSART